MNNPSLKRATYSALLTALAFWLLLFQLSKIRSVQNIAPFAEDPYDAVASVAFQIALGVAILSLARFTSIKDEGGLRRRAPFILRGILLVEVAVLVTLLADIVAIAGAWPLTLSTPMIFLIAGLGFLTALLITTGVLLIEAWQGAPGLTAEAVPDALGQSLRDCWMLVTVVAEWIVSRQPFLKKVWSWVDASARKIANLWNKRLPFADPDNHPWQFAGTVAVLSGILLMAGIMISETLWEGGPASPMIGWLLAAIFFAVETAIILLVFVIFGGYLGLRPRLRV
jgi:hypothetical protein